MTILPLLPCSPFLPCFGLPHNGEIQARHFTIPTNTETVLVGTVVSLFAFEVSASKANFVNNHPHSRNRVFLLLCSQFLQGHDQEHQQEHCRAASHNGLELFPAGPAATRQDLRQARTAGNAMGQGHSQRAGINLTLQSTSLGEALGEIQGL